MHEIWLVLNFLIQVYHMFNIKYCKMLTIAYFDMHSEDGATRIILWENLKVTIA